MRPSSVAEVVARVVAWHNRHPLARRITAAQVQGVGVVAMPFVLPRAPGSEAATPREPTLFDVIDLPAPAEAAASDAVEAPAPAAPSLRERALAAAGSGEPAAAPAVDAPAAMPPAESRSSWRARLMSAWTRLRPAARRGFSEDFIEPLSPRRVARFALRHGSLAAPPSAAGPVRQVLEDDGLCARGEVQTWHLRTAAIEVGSRRVRVLLGEGPDAAVIGPRLWSANRLAGSAAAWVLAMGGLIGAQLWHRAAPQAAPVLAHGGSPGAASAPAASAAASAAEVPVESVVLRSESAVVLPAESTAGAAHDTPASAAVAHGAAAAPPAVAARAAPGDVAASAPGAVAVAGAPVVAPAASSPPGAVASGPPVAALPAVGWPVNIRPVIDIETAREAKRESAAARAQAAERGAVVAAAPAQAAPRATPMAADDGKVYALAARSTRNRAASELLLGLMKTAAAASGDKGHHTEVLPSQQGWRAIWWPFHSRLEAEKAQALLVNVGLEAELVEF